MAKYLLLGIVCNLFIQLNVSAQTVVDGVVGMAGCCSPFELLMVLIPEDLTIT